MPVALAAMYGASLTATIRYTAEHHPEAVGLVVAGRYPRSNGSVPIWVAAQSKRFMEQFGSFRELLPTDGLAVKGEVSEVFGPIARAALSSSCVTSGEVRVRDRNGNWVRCSSQAFFNQRCLFVFVTPHRRLRHGRPLQVEAG